MRGKRGREAECAGAIQSNLIFSIQHLEKLRTALPGDYTEAATDLPFSPNEL